MPATEYKPFTLLYPPKIIFGCGKLSDLGKEVRAFGKEVLLVTGRSAIRKSGTLDRALDILKSSGVDAVLFEKIESDPSLKTVDEGTKLARDEKCDAVIGIGGGSPIDAAKAIASMAKQPATIWDYHAGREVEREGLPFIAVPTTAGTGAEITKNAVLSDTVKLVKKSVRSPFMVAKVAIVDPELTLSLPPDVTAYTGMDALTQAIESYVTKSSNPFTENLALRAIELIYHNLPDAVRCGDDIRIREKVALGSLLSAMAFSNSGLGAVHGLAHPIGVRFKVPHGLACAVLLPHVMELNTEAKPGKFDDIAAVIGCGKAEETPGAIRELLKTIGIPDNFRDRGISEDDLPTIIAGSKSSSMSKNPRALSDQEIEELMQKVM